MSTRTFEPAARLVLTSTLGILLATAIAVPGIAEPRAAESTRRARRSMPPHAVITNAAGEEMRFRILDWVSEVGAERDAASGLPTGKRQHKPFTIAKSVDETASAFFLGGLVSGSTAAPFDVEIHAFSRRGPAAERQFLTIELLGASVAGIRMESLNNKYPENTNVEEVAFYYNKITFKFENTGDTFEDEYDE